MSLKSSMGSPVPHGQACTRAHLCFWRSDPGHAWGKQHMWVRGRVFPALPPRDVSCIFRKSLGKPSLAQISSLLLLLSRLACFPSLSALALQLQPRRVWQETWALWENLSRFLDRCLVRVSWAQTAIFWTSEPVCPIPTITSGYQVHQFPCPMPLHAFNQSPNNRFLKG